MLNTINEKLLPQALMIGIDYDLFWKLNPRSLSPFIKAFGLKQEQLDTVAWQQGIYIQKAIASIMDKNAKYPTKPMFSSKEEKKPMSMEEIKAKFMAKAISINSQFRKE